ncbi:ATPase [Streptomyces sp. SKN60]|uniref:N-acetylglucosamine kinase n=1 Tax=Streptomyces sp. SKN60 TaxID=2855506 RepID=UPI002245F791|nr:BadF/BadG/BcrA/BcrD ATPase family protein [Streptomyces sp. SKN60]MCX2183041.1 ATPase [Streptomyces sp. SKN60]
MNGSSIQRVVVGIDAGGTRTRARCADAATGTALGEGTGGPGNALSVPAEELVRHLAEALRGALPPGAGGAVGAVVAGFAGGGPGGGAERAGAALRAALAEVGAAPARIVVHGDAEVAFAAGPGTPADGLVLIAGTGAAGARVVGRRLASAVDGDGWLLGDAGSGFWLGREALRAVLRALDGRGPATALSDPVAALCGGLAKERLVGWAYAAHPVRLAGLSPLVVDAAAAGDAVATGLLDRAADELTVTVRALLPRPGEPLVVTGGLLGPGGPLLDRLSVRVAALGLVPSSVPDGLAGAVALARLADPAGPAAPRS